MIDLTIEELILWMVGVPLIWVGMYLLLYQVKHYFHRRQKKREIITCRICGNVYRDTSREKMPPCPVCDRLNYRGDPRRLG